jgi:hypothetical protein
MGQKDTEKKDEQLPDRRHAGKSSSVSPVFDALKQTREKPVGERTNVSNSLSGRGSELPSRMIFHNLVASNGIGD